MAAKARQLNMRLYGDLPEHREIIDWLDGLPKDRRGIRGLNFILEEVLLDYVRKQDKPKRQHIPKKKGVPAVPVSTAKSVPQEPVSVSQTVDAGQSPDGNQQQSPAFKSMARSIKFE